MKSFKLPNVLWVLTLLSGLLTGHQSHALIEARLTYGLLASTPDLTQLYSGSGTTPAVAPTYGFGGDFIFVIPVVGIGAGVRYDSYSLDVKSNGVQAQATNNRTSLIVNYRLINTLMFLGPIFTYGLSHSGSLKTSLNDVVINDWTINSYSSYSAGLEVGVKLAGFMVGGEAGYEDLRWNGATDSKGAISGTKDINMSGTYFKVLLGFAI